MANPEHVDVVRKGKDAIAEWRQANPDERLDLSGADLSLANLHGADLWEANLAGANLSGARLVRADLGLASLVNADLTGAYLSGADLNVALLHGADLSGADLGQAKLSWSNLSGTVLRGSRMQYTSLSNIDLSQARGVETVKHLAPSTIGVDTLIASFRGAGNKLTPELRTFFRSAGVPQAMLDALPKIVSQIRYYSCFISYGQPDLRFAKKLCEDLKTATVDCWFYPHDKTVGEDTQREIAAARRRADKMIVICSVAGLMRDGLLREIEDQAEEDAGKLMPVSLDLLWKERNFPVVRGAQDLKPFLLLKNYGYFASWDSEPERYQKGLDDLLKGLRRPEVKKTRRSRKSP